jgi:hypothetical protein
MPKSHVFGDAIAELAQFWEKGAQFSAGGASSLYQ